MNHENMRKVIDHLKMLSKHNVNNVGFNMGYFWDSEDLLLDHSGFDCSTTACIAGHTVYLLRNEFDFTDPDLNFQSNAQELLGLTEDETMHLFYAHKNGEINVALEKITLDQAIGAMQRMLAGKAKIWDWEC